MIPFIKRSRKNLVGYSTRYFSSATKCDALVLGGGIGGTSISYRLAKLHNLNVICLEKEDSPGYNATGKAFGLFAESNARCLQSKLLTTASRPFFESPDEECFDDYIRDNFDGILTKTGLLAISSPDCYSYLYEQFGPSEKIKFDQNIQVYSQKDVVNMVPFLNTEELAPYGIYEPNAANFNIGLVYEHFLVGGNNVGVQYYWDQSAVEINKLNNGNWEVLAYNAETNNIDRFEAGIVVNCTGQYSDETAKKAGIRALDLETISRNILVFTYSKGDIDEKPYESSKYSFRSQKHDDDDNDETHEVQTPWLGWISPQAEQVFHSCFQGGNGVFLYDEVVDVAQCQGGIDHAGHDEMEIALGKISKYTTLKVKKIASKAAGIRVFNKYDKNIVIGPSLEDNSFIFCAALGGYGVQTAPAYSEIASYLAVNKELPKWYIDLGVDVEKLLPKRLYQDDNIKKGTVNPE